MSLEQEFQLLWSSNRHPDVVQFLTEHAPQDAREWLEILLVDQRNRWKTKEPFQAEDYLASFPKLLEGIHWKLQLAVGDFAARLGADNPGSEALSS